LARLGRTARVTGWSRQGGRLFLYHGVLSVILLNR
jgi:hypothetical protein